MTTARKSEEQGRGKIHKPDILSYSISNFLSDTHSSVSVLNNFNVIEACYLQSKGRISQNSFDLIRYLSALLVCWQLLR